jgi:hypothetical protein
MQLGGGVTLLFLLAYLLAFSDVAWYKPSLVPQ